MLIIIIILLLLYILSKFSFSDGSISSNKKTKKQTKYKKQETDVKCPLCNSTLFKGEDLYTRVYRPMNVPDQLCTISGCPHCFPSVEQGKKRECPVCHKVVPIKNGHLTARLFNKVDGKKHVIVTGCSECCKH